MKYCMTGTLHWFTSRVYNFLQHDASCYARLENSYMWLSDHNTIIFIPLLHMMSQVDTLTEHHILCMCHQLQLWILFSNWKMLHDVAWFFTSYKISALVAHWHSDSCTSCSVSLQTVPQHWYRKNKNATGKGGNCKFFDLCSTFWRAAWR